MKYIVRIEEKQFEIEITENNGRITVKMDGRQYPARILESTLPYYSILLGNTVLELEAEIDGPGQEIVWKGNKFKAQVADQRVAQIENAAITSKPASKDLKSPLPGVIIKIEVEDEQEVQAGQGILILEAMKMENEIKSPFPGKIKKVLVRERQTVEKNQALVVFA